MFNPVEIIRKKRDGEELSKKEIDFFISGVVKKTIPEYQASAWLMAVYQQGMTVNETVALTETMTNSGERIVFKDSKPKIDKHSTGGIGDKVSLILAPLVASLGVDVPMVAGRGLGHTGGTLDKLESIPGFSIHLSSQEFVQNVSKTGMCIMGQSENFAPADKILYALRDVTATVECTPLITGSILSKKAAEGISGLVLDVKVGSGAFMKTPKEAEKLAKSLVFVGKKLGLKMTALLTDMNQPLGKAIGNSLEVLECIEVLKGKGPEDLRELTLELAAYMIVLGEKASALSSARRMVKEALDSGAGLRKFEELCRAQGCTKDILNNPEQHLKVADSLLEISAPKTGFLSQIDGQKLGMLLIELGGGRKKTTDKIDPSVGYISEKRIGDKLKKGDVILKVFYNPKSLQTDLNELTKEFLSCYSLSTRSPQKPKLIKKVIT